MNLNSAKTIILLPVFNDWQALQKLITEFSLLIQKDQWQQYFVLVINDGSLEIPPDNLGDSLKVSQINLTHNIGHQKAIAIGLSYAYHNLDFQNILVMDADGDDRPEDAVKLLAAVETNEHQIIVGLRTQRNDTTFKKVFYSIYLFIFKMLAGKSIRFGNFCILPKDAVRRLIHKEDLWVHLPASIIKSGIPYSGTITSKGNRYNGSSKMNFTSLFYHGIGAIAAFIDVIAIRLLIASGIAICISLLCLLSIFFIRLTTNLAIPGWASLLAAMVIIIILISFLIALFLIFTFSTSQSYRKFIPAFHYKEFIETEAK